MVCRLFNLAWNLPPNRMIRHTHKAILFEHERTASCTVCFPFWCQRFFLYEETQLSWIVLFIDWYNWIHSWSVRAKSFWIPLERQLEQCHYQSTTSSGNGLMSCCHIVISCSGRVYFCAEALFLEQCLILEWTPLLLENSQFGQEKGQ
jgi:hypothetical protein